MDYNAILQSIGSIGFPIVCCLYLITTMQQELKELRETIVNNTVVIQKLCDKLGEEKS